MTPLQVFFKKNSFNFGNEGAPEISPNNVLTVLRLGLKNYYETYQADIKHPPLGFFKANGKIIPMTECSHEFLARYYSAIGFVQLFLELYIVEFLDEISTVITRNKIKESCFLAELKYSGITDELKNNNTIFYTRILKRVKILFDNESDLPDELRIPSKYRFFRNHLETLQLLNDLRNDIMHSGKQVLYNYSFDLLFVNYVFPIVQKIIEIEDNTIFLNRNIHCGLNVIEEFNRIQLPQENLYQLSEKKYENLKYFSNKISHLKELGRASIENPLFMGEFGDDELKDKLEKQNEQKRQIAEIEANITHEALNYHERFICPCCGTKALMTYRSWIFFDDNSKRPERAKCLLCSYSISIHLGEPKDFGVMKKTIFNMLIRNDAPA